MKRQSKELYTKLKIEDILILFGMISVGYGEIGIYNITQYLVGITFVFLLVKYILFNQIITVSFKKIIWFLFIIIYVIGITVIFNPYFFDAILGLLYFIVVFSLFVMYTKFTDKKKLLYILYQTAYIISIIGVFEELLFFVNKDIFSSLFVNLIYGKLSFVNLGLNLIRVSSVFSEPAHLAPLLSVAFAIIIESQINNSNMMFPYVKKNKNIIILLCSIFTFSIVVYISILLVILIYFILLNNIKKKAGIIIKWIITPFIALTIIRPDALYRWLFDKFINQIFLVGGLTTNNLTGFALISNLRIAIEKMKDGYIFGTGFESHSIYYWKYIDTLYTSVYQYLNVNDSGSIYIRVLSEFGIVGLLLFIIFIVRHLIISKTTMSTNNLANAKLHRIAVVGLIVYCLRNGSYVNPLFVMPLAILICYKSEKYHTNKIMINTE